MLHLYTLLKGSLGAIKAKKQLLYRICLCLKTYKNLSLVVVSSCTLRTELSILDFNYEKRSYFVLLVLLCYHQLGYCIKFNHLNS